MQTIEDQFSWCNVEPEVKQLLFDASENWEDTERASLYINEALSKSGNNIDVLIGAYRFFFYKHQPAAALSIAERVLESMATAENLPAEWSLLKPVLITRKDEPNVRLYLNAYAAKSLILAQLGKMEEAKVISERVKEIDDKREFCATTVFEVISRDPDADEYEDDE